MRPEYQDLWKRIESYELDKPGSAFPFSAKLAKENGWSRDFTLRAIEEYKRFVFLGIAAGHPVSPSYDVDEVWHMHLQYTDDYFNRFCAQVLGRQFHHNPTQGGPEASAKFDDWYAKTLASYEQFFGEKPPKSIWPPPGRQFDKARVAEIDPKTHWIVRKPRLRLRSFHFVVLLAPLVLIWGCAAAGSGGNPLDYTGPEFLQFYFWLELACVVVALLVRRMLSNMGASTRAHTNLDADCVAYLQGGQSRVSSAAVAGLIGRGAVALDPVTNRLCPAIDDLKDGTPTERQVFAWIRGAGSVHPRFFAGFNVPDCRQIEGELQQMGMLVPAGRAFRVVFIPLLISMLAPVIGVVKIDVGISRDRPVDFLVMFCVVSVAVNLAIFTRKPRRSPLADSILREMSQRYSYLRNPLAADPSAEELMLTVGLFGITALANGPLDYLAPHLRAPGSSGGSGGSSGCSSSSGGSSGCSSSSSCSGGGGGCGGGCSGG